MIIFPILLKAIAFGCSSSHIAAIWLLLTRILLHPSSHSPPSVIGADFSLLLKAPGTTNEEPYDFLWDLALKMGMAPNQVILLMAEINEASDM